MKVKLSVKQRAILQRLARGEKLYRMQYTGSQWSGPQFEGWDSVPAPSVDGLQVRLLIEQAPYKFGSFEVVYKITQAGREALEATATTGGQRQED